MEYFKKNNKSFIWILKKVINSKYAIFLLTILQSLTALLTTLYPIITLKLLNAVEQKNKEEFYNVLSIFILTIIFQLIIWFINTLYSEYVYFSIENNFKKFCLSSWLNRDDIYQKHLHTGELMNRFTSDIKTITDGCINIVPNLLSIIVRLIATGVFLYILLPDMAYIMFFGSLCMFIGTIFIRKKIKSAHKKVNEKDGEVRSYLQEIFQNPIIIKSFGVEKVLKNRVSELIEKYRIVFWKKVKLVSSSQLAINTVFNFAIILGTTIASIQIIDGKMPIGIYVAVAQLISQMRNPLVKLTSFIPKYFMMLASAERLMEINENYDNSSESVNIKNNTNLLVKSIHFKNIDFNYDDRKDNFVLSKFSLDIHKGEHLGIVGKSGSGKSTFLKILLGVYYTTGGEIILNCLDGNVALSNSNIKNYRELFSYVPQSNSLMSGTIRDIVTFSKINSKEDEEKLIKVLEISCSLDFVKSLPKGLDSTLQEAGEGISGGQIQRLAIARAIFLDRPFLVLDEATNSLDEKTEIQLLNNLKKLNDKTIIFVSHKKQSLAICDRIVDFDNMKGK